MNWRFWQKNKKIVYTALPSDIIGESESQIDMSNLTKEEFEFILTRFVETIQNLMYMTMKDRIRVGLNGYRNNIIKGEEKVTVQYCWGILGNDLIMWLGEFRRKKENGKWMKN